MNEIISFPSDSLDHKPGLALLRGLSQEKQTQGESEASGNHFNPHHLLINISTFVSREWTSFVKCNHFTNWILELDSTKKHV